MTNSEIEPFLSYSPSQRTKFIILSTLTIAGTGSWCLKEGAALFQTIFPSPAARPRHKKQLAAGEGSGLGLLWNTTNKKKSGG